MAKFFTAEYDRIAESWCRRRQKLPPKDKVLVDAFIRYLPVRSRLLDLGCGSGVPIGNMLCRSGFRVTGVDRSAKLLERAAAAMPGAGLVRADLLHLPLNAVKGGFDGAVMWDVLFHLPRETHIPILESIYTRLHPGGCLIFTSGGCHDNIPPFTDHMFGVEFYYDAMPPDQTVRSCEALGFKVREYAVLNQPDGGRDKGRIGLLVSRP